MKRSDSLQTASPLSVGLVCALCASLALISPFRSLGLSDEAVIVLASVAYAAPGIWWEYRRKRLSYAARERSIRWRIPFLKTLGLAQILAVAWLVYYSFPEYGHARYEAAAQIMPSLAAALVIVAPLYFGACEAVLPRRRDAYLYIGRFSILVFLVRLWTRPVLRRHLLLWLVKLFFLPLMIGSLAFSVSWLSSHPLSRISDFVAFFDYYWEVVLALDVLLAIVGYVCSLRLLGTEVVFTDESWRGWTATLACYAPFSTVLYGSYLTYEDGLRWGDVFQGHPVAYVVYGSVLLAVHTLYLVASLNFGIRYSNLSHRGILTDGLFRLTKHPAYFFKQVVWWMIAVPFLSTTSWVDAVLNCAILLAVNVVYWWRGRTEERNLSRDPNYVAYALSMNERSMFRIVSRAFPTLTYKPPSHAAKPLVRCAHRS